MKGIKLTRGFIAIVDDEDYDLLNAYRWHVDFIKGRRYASASNIIINGKFFKTIRMHRAILNTDTGVSIDHMDSDGLNNRRSNLRIATQTENMQNVSKRINCSSIYKGVHWHYGCNKWRAVIKHNKKLIHLGLYENEKDAAIEYNKNAEILFGKFAKLNVV